MCELHPEAGFCQYVPAQKPQGMQPGPQMAQLGNPQQPAQSYTPDGDGN